MDSAHFWSILCALVLMFTVNFEEDRFSAGDQYLLVAKGNAVDPIPVTNVRVSDLAGDRNHNSRGRLVVLAGDRPVHDRGLGLGVQSRDEQQQLDSKHPGLIVPWMVKSSRPARQVASAAL